MCLSKIKTIILSVTCCLFISCTEQGSVQKPNILARVGNRIITVQDFIRRSEYTPRPAYCAMDNYIHKKIILNSLIAEKILALDAEKRGALKDNKSFQAFIRGRKEQSMRQWHYYKIAYEKVKVDSQEVRPFFRNAGKRYRIAYFITSDSSEARELEKFFGNDSLVFNKKIWSICGSDTLPVAEVSWNGMNDPPLQEELFSRIYQKGDLFGPVRTTDGNILVGKVLGWTERIAFTDRDIRDRYNQIDEFLRERKADLIYEKYVGNLMAGKEMHFFPIIKELAQRVGKVYLGYNRNKKMALNKSLWNEEMAMPIGEIGDIFGDFPDKPLFEVDGKVWTVSDFKKLVMSHPLVFRKKRITGSEFLLEFRNAIADLVRDYYITEDAYKKGYDQVAAVIQNTNLWNDHLLAIDERVKILREKGFEGDFSEMYLEAIQKYLNPYIDSLQISYSPEIEIDMDKFEQLQITGVDMMVVQFNLPYPVPVPAFPMLTTDNKLDYGRNMD